MRFGRTWRPTKEEAERRQTLVSSADNARGVLSSTDDPRTVLGVSENATAEELRAAYLRGVKEHPPDRSPAEFERIRDAYQLLQDPQRRSQLLFLSDDPTAPLVSLLDQARPRRRFVGPEPWLTALHESQR